MRQVSGKKLTLMMSSGLSWIGHVSSNFYQKEGKKVGLKEVKAFHESEGPINAIYAI